MPVTLQVLYPTTNDTTFDHAYYAAKHFPLAGEAMGPFCSSLSVSKGLAGGPDTPAGYHTIATLVFENQAALDSALAVSEPVLADIPNFFSGEPQMLIGEVVA